MDGGALLGERLPLAHLGGELALPLLQRLQPLLELPSSALLLGEGDDRAEVGLCYALELRREAGLPTAQLLAPGLEFLRQPVPSMRSLQRPGDLLGMR